MKDTPMQAQMIFTRKRTGIESQVTRLALGQAHDDENDDEGAAFARSVRRRYIIESDDDDDETSRVPQMPTERFGKTQIGREMLEGEDAVAAVRDAMASRKAQNRTASAL